MSRPSYFRPDRLAPAGDRIEADVCVYGGTAAGVIAARVVADTGRTAVIVNPAGRLGGMTSHGLGCTDVGNPSIVGGMTRALYEHIGSHYGQPIAWRFEPHVAQAVIDKLAALDRISVVPYGYLSECRTTSAIGGPGEARIEEIRLLGGQRIRATSFIDASYEGDLMAAAGVPFRLGREPSQLYGEPGAGMQFAIHHQFDTDVSPWIVPGDSTSGLLPGIEPTLWSSRDIDEYRGSGDTRIQAYNFRLCMTDNAENRVEWIRPDDYDPAVYELAARWLQNTSEDLFWKFDPIPGNKTDTNNHGAVSSDLIGGNWLWPTADYASREEIFQRHVQYHRGLLWFMSHDQRVPEAIREPFARWGLAADEFVETDHWPEQLYVREARRMHGMSTVTEHMCRSDQAVSDPVAMGAYQLDSHNCRRIIVNGTVRNEGDIQVQLPRPYGIPLGAIVPREDTVTNLVVPVAVSASHIAFGSIRMEPVFMELAEAAAVVTACSLETGRAVQQIPYEEIRERLIAQGQVLETTQINEFSRLNAADWFDSGE